MDLFDVSESRLPQVYIQLIVEFFLQILQKRIKIDIRPKEQPQKIANIIIYYNANLNRSKYTVKLEGSERASNGSERRERDGCRFQVK